jgi:hypothetical protein
MNKQEREQFTKQLREADDFELCKIAESYMTENHDEDFEARRAKEAQWLKRTFGDPPPAAPQQSSGYVTSRELDEVMEFLGEETGKVHKQLLDKIAALEAELNLVKALARGEVRMIEDMRDAKAS